MKSYYADRFGEVEEPCYVDIHKPLITEEERLELLEIYHHNSHKDFNSHHFKKNETNDLTTRRIEPCYDAKGKLIIRRTISGGGGNGQNSFVRVVHVNLDGSLSSVQKIRTYLGAREGDLLAYSFFFTLKDWISSCHCEVRSPTLNICLLDSGASIYFFDESQKVISEHKFNGRLCHGVIYNTARWHMIFNETSGDRLALSINLTRETGRNWIANTPNFISRAKEIYENCH